MDRRTYKRLRKRDVVGRRVVARRAIGNSLGTLPAGSTATIKDKGAGYALEFDPCGECGLRLYVVKVDPSSIDLIDEVPDVR